MTSPPITGAANKRPKLDCLFLFEIPSEEAKKHNPEVVYVIVIALNRYKAACCSLRSIVSFSANIFSSLFDPKYI